MEAKYPWLVVLVSTLSLPAIANEVTNDIRYNTLYADLSAGSLNENLGVNNNVTALSVGGNYLLLPNTLATLDYTARFIHPNDLTTELYTLLPGVAYRYPLMPRLDVIATGKVGYLWATQTQDSTDQELYRNSELMLGASLEAKYAVTKDWEMAVRGEMNRSDILDENIFHLRADYQFSPRLTVGGFYTHRNGDYQTSQINGKATTNEGGISLRYLF